MRQTRTFVRRLQRPLVSMLLLTLLVGETSLLCRAHPRDSIVARNLTATALPTGPRVPRWTMQRRAGVWSETKVTWPSQADAVVRVGAVGPRTLESGFWWPATRRQIFSIIVLSDATGPDGSSVQLTPQDGLDIRTVVCQEITSCGFTLPAGAVTADIDQEEILWPRVVRNTADAAMLVFFLLSLRWFGSWLRPFVPVPLGTCARCGYNLGGLTTATCPECGTRSN